VAIAGAALQASAAGARNAIHSFAHTAAFDAPHISIAASRNGTLMSGAGRLAADNFSQAVAGDTAASAMAVGSANGGSAVLRNFASAIAVEAALPRGGAITFSNALALATSSTR